MRRIRMSRIKAQTPTCWVVGRTAIAKEPADISVTLRVSAALRPFRSAYRPKNQAPIGRIRNDVENTAIASRPAWRSSLELKKCDWK
jgi:hypothetical protein